MIITVHALGTYVAPEKIFTYGISTIHDSDIRYAREKNVKIKLVAQVVKVSDEHFTMFVMPEFVTPSKYIYSVDDEYNGVVIRGECYDRPVHVRQGGREPAHGLVDPERHHGPPEQLPLRVQETELHAEARLYDGHNPENLCAVPTRPTYTAS